MTNPRNSLWRTGSLRTVTAPPRNSRGFTLIELLAVLFVVGMALSGAMLVVSQGGPEKQVGKQVEKFAAYSEYARELAIISGDAVGLVFEPPVWRDDPLNEGWRYRWQTLTYEGWADIEGLPATEFDRDIALSVTIEEQLWTYKPNEKPEIIAPIIAFYPGGDITPFEIEFTHKEEPDLSEHVEVDSWGNVVWREKAEMMEELKQQFE